MTKLEVDPNVAIKVKKICQAKGMTVSKLLEKWADKEVRPSWKDVITKPKFKVTKNG